MEGWVWASTGIKDPAASDLLCIKALALPVTVNTMPEPVLNALAEHGDIESTMAVNGGDCKEALTRFAKGGISP